tara:strand:- start:3879 stop:4184 length:306 start_codon:yes stop_codon:yes gene_type:complete
MSYTKAEEQSIRNNAPITYEKAEQLASNFGKTVRSVISKSVSLKVYQKREQSQKIDRPQKKDTVRAIEKTFGLREGELQGLTNARGETLGTLYKLIAEAIN